MEQTEIAGKSVGTRLRNVSNAMAMCMVEKLMAVMMAILVNLAPTGHAIFSF